MSRETRGDTGTPGHRLLPRSIRWRLQLWLAFLLICVLTGFGITIYERQRVNHFRQIDAELEVRVAALSRVVRDYYHDALPSQEGKPPEAPASDGAPDGLRPPPPDDPFGGPPEHRRHEHRPPPDGSPPGPPRNGPQKTYRAMPGRAPSELPLSSQAAALFGEGGGPYYFLVWYRDGTVLKRSENTPAAVPLPGRFERDTLPHFRTRQSFREVVHCSGLGECVLAGRSVQADLETMRSFRWALLAAGGAVLNLVPTCINRS